MSFCLSVCQLPLLMGPLSLSLSPSLSVSCLMSHVPCPIPHAPYPMPHIPCPLSNATAPCPMPHASCPMPPVHCPLYHAPCPMSHVLYPVPPVSCLPLPPPSPPSLFFSLTRDSVLSHTSLSPRVSEIIKNINCHRARLKVICYCCVRGYESFRVMCFVVVSSLLVELSKE